MKKQFCVLYTKGKKMRAIHSSNKGVLESAHDKLIAEGWKKIDNRKAGKWTKM